MIDDNDENMVHLLVNPMFVRPCQKNRENQLNNEIIALLQRKFNNHEINEKYTDIILSKIENICEEYSIKHIVESILKNIVTYAIEQSYE